MRMSREKMTMCLSFQGASNLPLMCSWVMLLSNRVSPAKFRSKLAIFFLELPCVGPLAYSFRLKLTTFVFLSKFVYFFAEINSKNLAGNLRMTSMSPADGQ